MYRIKPTKKQEWKSTDEKDLGVRFFYLCYSPFFLTDTQILFIIIIILVEKFFHSKIFSSIIKNQKQKANQNNNDKRKKRMMIQRMLKKNYISCSLETKQRKKNSLQSSSLWRACVLITAIIILFVVGFSFRFLFFWLLDPRL